MSQKSVELIAAMASVFLEVAQTGQMPCVENITHAANILDNFTATSASVTNIPNNEASVSQKEGGCPKILSSGPRKGIACGNRLKNGCDFCSTHVPKDQKTSSKAKTEPSQSGVIGPPPAFNFSARSNETAAVPVFQPNTNNMITFTPQSASANKEHGRPAFIPNFQRKEKAKFFKKQAGSKSLLFTDEPQYKNFVFEDLSDGRNFIGIIPLDANIDLAGEQLENDFIIKYLRDVELTPVQSEWCFTNNIIIPDTLNHEEES